MSYGDSVDEEWYIVSILLRITEKINHVAIRIWDDDGEFLLIETATSLPKWIKPENSHNRVFLYKGQIHIVKKNKYSNKLDIKTALHTLLHLEHECQVSGEIKALLKMRLYGLPHDRHRHLHLAR